MQRPVPSSVAIKTVTAQLMVIPSSMTMDRPRCDSVCWSSKCNSIRDERHPVRVESDNFREKVLTIVDQTIEDLRHQITACGCCGYCGLHGGRGLVTDSGSPAE
jgi:hypothetical protein